ncbi:MAG: phenylacetate--CoA ligase [Chloroflexi bacterium]|nr:phenylacetate--CoA ligase [Chloroflexota bacterium]
MYWDKVHETMPRAELQQLQLRRLQAKVREVYEKVPFYREAFQQKGLSPESVRSLADLAKLPFTTKQDFRDNYPLGLAAVPRSEIVRLHASSGTTGKPTVVAYTRADISLWSEMMARTLTMCGVTSHDVVHNAYGYGLFTGGLGIHYGAERVGAAVIPMSGGNSKRQIMLLQDLGSTVICCTPSYALYLAETADEMGVDLRASQLRVGIFGAEPWSFRMRDEIEAKLGILALDIYGLSEIIGPGVAQECPQKNGLHIFEDHFLAEVVDPVTGEALPDGKKGELVVSTITKEGLPVIRYRTRDITALHHETCACGRTLVRMDKVTGRTDDMLIVRGVNVFPSQIESVLLEVEGVEPHYLIVVDREHTLDDLEIWVEVSEQVFSDEIRTLEALGRRVRAEIESVLGINARVKLVEPRSIQRSEGKAKRVIDRREL